MPRILHTADWQIGRSYGTFPAENATPLAEARLSAVERLAALATAQQAHAVLVAGDVFDAQTVPDRTLRRLFNALAGFAGPWVLLPGNHDAALTESVWTRALRLGAVPANVHLALAAQPVLLPLAGLAVLPAPLSQRHSFGDLTAWFDEAVTPDGLLRVGLAHGCVQGILAEGIDSPNPLAPDRADRAALSYLALGDWHGTRPINARTWYAGTPEPDRFRSVAAGQALIVDLPADGGLPQVTPVATAQFQWRAWQTDLQIPADLDTLVDALDALTPADVAEVVVRGVLDLPGQQRLQQARGRAEARARHLVVDTAGVQLAPTEEDLAALQADGYLAEVLADLRQMQGEAGPAARTATDALALLTQLLAETRPAPRPAA